MRITRSIAAMVLVAVLLAGCGDDATDESATSTTTSTSTSDGSSTPSTTASTTASSEPTSESTTSTSGSTSTTGATTLEQPAIWPAADVVFDSPEAAASDFVSKVFGVPPNLGSFQQGDSRSGEIEVLSPAEDAGTAIRSVLLLRQLGLDTDTGEFGAIPVTID